MIFFSFWKITIALKFSGDLFSYECNDHRNLIFLSFHCSTDGESKIFSFILLFFAILIGIKK